jgi:DNA processing protein
MNQEIMFRIALIQLPGIGDLFAKLLVEYFSSSKKLFGASKKELEVIPGIGKVLLATLCNPVIKKNALYNAQKEIEFTEQHGISIFTYDDEFYPEKLKECNDGPFLLFYKGSSVINRAKIISIVGTRKSSVYGEDMTRKIVQELSALDVLIVSGLAHGIDACAHKFSLDNNTPTIGVLAHGLDKLYPYRNRELAKRMLNNGGLLTEFRTGTNPNRENFPKRNRIVAGMADATIVIEAAKKGGALITANIAHSYGRDVFAVSGRSIDTYSLGCNKLIKANKAALIESGDDVLKAMNWVEVTNTTKPSKQLHLFEQLNTEERIILDIINKNGIANKEQIANSLNKSVQNVSALLFNLELNGVIKALPGNNYQLKV